MKKSLFVIRKELKYILKSKSFLLILLIASLLPVAAEIKDKSVVKLLCAVLLIQRICDKSKKELVNGTSLFCINLRVSFRRLYFIQALFSVPVCLLPFVCSLRIIEDTDLFCVSSLIVFMCFLYTVTVFLSYLCAFNTFIAYILAVLALLAMFFLQQIMSFGSFITVCIVFSVVFYVLSEITYKSKFFRLYLG